MHFRLVAISLCVATFAVTFRQAAAEPAPGDAGPAERPNVVLIISDDHAWTDYGFMGSREARTPHLDQLAAEGLTFERGYVTTALCSPSLATMLSGLHPHQHGISGNDPLRGESREDWLDPFCKLPLLPRLLADAGYLTLHTGKLWTRDPARVGFTDSMGATGRHGGQALAIGRETMEPIFTAIDKARGERRPFFIWYAPFLPHTPHNPPPRLLDKYAHIEDPARAKYLAMVEWLDETCGQLFARLERQGVADNTVIFYLADNGWNEFGKGHPYENGVRTPVILRWPGRVDPRRDRQHLATNLDVLPTILAACGVDGPPSLAGIDLLDAAAVADRDTIFLSNFAHDMVSPGEPGRSLWSRSCIRGRWKLIAHQASLPAVRPYNNGDRRKTPGAAVELFDLTADPHETRNVAAEQAAVMTDLQSRLDAWWNPAAATDRRTAEE
ncbi:MAG: sulfatase [Planctomycetota bacterium]|nr:MAG: sulfatase [Planctomycetota bacterium]REK40478.1 MAG: sulfatase [Planctomycetota bacterium]